MKTGKRVLVYKYRQTQRRTEIHVRSTYRQTSRLTRGNLYKVTDTKRDRNTCHVDRQEGSSYITQTDTKRETTICHIDG